MKRLRVSRWAFTAFVLLLLGAAMRAPVGLSTSSTQVDPGLLPVGWWKMDAIEQGRVRDFGSSAHDGVLFGDPESVAGNWDQGLALDGEDDYVQAGAYPEYRLRENITISAWVQVPPRDQNGKPNPALLGKAGSYALRLRGAKTTRPELTLQIPDAQETNSYGYVVCTGEKALDMGWHHLAATYERASRTMMLYVDAGMGSGEVQECKIRAKRGFIESNADAPLVLGLWAPNNNSLLEGAIDDVRLWDRALSADEVADVYAGVDIETAPATAENLVATPQGAGAIQLSWSHESEPFPSGFMIERKNAASKGRWVTLAAVPAADRAFLDAGLGRFTGHLYRIRAFGLGGFSRYSRETAAITDPDGFEPEAPLGWWKMDAIQEGAVVDTGGSPHDAVLFGDPQLVSGWLGNALSLDGEGDYARPGNHPEYRIRDEISILAWVQAPAREPGGKPHPAIVGKAGSYALRFAGSRENRPQLALHIPDAEGDEFGYVVCTADQSVESGWHFLAGTYRRGSRKMTLYVDGIDGRGSGIRVCTVEPRSGKAPGGSRDDDGSSGQGRITRANSPLYLGLWTPNRNSMLSGAIDDVRLYDRELSFGEIFRIYVESILRARPPEDTTPPSPVDSLHAAAFARQVVLSWEPSLDPPPASGAAGYRIFRDGVLLDQAEELMFVDSDVVPRTTHHYQVIAFDHAGNESEAAEVTATTPGAVAVDKVVSSGGGILSTPGGELTVRVPPGALRSAEEVTITIEEIAGPVWALGPTYALGPGGTEFREPVQVWYEYPAELAHLIESGGRQLLISNDPEYWETLWDSGIDRQARRLYGTTHHFSRLAVGQGRSMAGVHWYERNTADSLVDGSIPDGLKGWNVESLTVENGIGPSQMESFNEARAAKEDGLVNFIRLDYKGGEVVPRSENDLQRWGDDFIEVVKHFSGENESSQEDEDVADLYIVGNEPLIQEDGSITAGEYVRAFNYITDRKDEMPPGTRLLLAGPNAFGPDSLSWLETVLNDVSDLDALALHTYGHVDSAGVWPDCPQDPRQPCVRGNPPWAWDGGFRYYQDQIDRIPSRFRSKPIYLTEFNTDTNGLASQNPHENYPQDFINQAFEEIRNYNGSCSSNPILALVWFVDWDDQGQWNDFALSSSAGRMPTARADMKEELANEANRGPSCEESPPPPDPSAHPLCLETMSFPETKTCVTSQVNFDLLYACQQGQPVLCESGCIPQNAAHHDLCSSPNEVPDAARCDAGGLTVPVGRDGDPGKNAVTLPDGFDLQLPFPSTIDHQTTQIKIIKSYGPEYGPNWWTALAGADDSHCEDDLECSSCEASYCSDPDNDCSHCTHWVTHKRVADSSRSNDYYALDLAYVGRSDNGYGDPVLAAADGTVEFAGEATGGFSSFGNVVVLKQDHQPSGRTFYFLYAHLDAIAGAMQPGQSVAQGTEIGTLGRSGLGPSGTAHVHFSIYEHTESNPVIVASNPPVGGRAAVPEPIDGYSCLASRTGGEPLVPGGEPGETSDLFVQDEQMSDGNWDFVLLERGNGGTVEVGQANEDGNTYRRSVSTVNGGFMSSVTEFHFQRFAVYDPATEGALESVDLFEKARTLAQSPVSLQLTADFATIRQNGAYYLEADNGWAPENLEGFWLRLRSGLRAEDFQCSDGGCMDGAHPDFSGTAPPVELGYARRSFTFNNNSWTFEYREDDWSARFHPVGGPAATLVKVIASDPVIEDVNDPGELTLERAGDVSSPLVVKYEVGGPGWFRIDRSDFVGSVSFPAGVATVKLPVRPLAPSACDNQFRLILTPTADYRLSDREGYYAEIAVGPAGPCQ